MFGTKILLFFLYFWRLSLAIFCNLKSSSRIDHCGLFTHLLFLTSIDYSSKWNPQSCFSLSVLILSWTLFLNFIPYSDYRNSFFVEQKWPSNLIETIIHLLLACSIETARLEGSSLGETNDEGSDASFKTNWSISSKFDS